MQKSHKFLFKDFKVSKNQENFKNYPTFFNLLTISLRIFIVLMVALAPLHKIKGVTMIVIQEQLFLFYTCMLMYYTPYFSRMLQFTIIINHMYMIFTYLFFQQQHRDHFYNSSFDLIENILVNAFYFALLVNSLIVLIETIKDCIDKQQKKKER